MDKKRIIKHNIENMWRAFNTWHSSILCYRYDHFAFYVHSGSYKSTLLLYTADSLRDWRKQFRYRTSHQISGSKITFTASLYEGCYLQRLFHVVGIVTPQHQQRAWDLSYRGVYLCITGKNCASRYIAANTGAFLSYQWARQIYRIASSCPPGHPMTTAALRDKIKPDSCIFVHSTRRCVM